MDEDKRFEMLFEDEDDPETREWLAGEIRREEAETAVMVKAVVAEVHARLRHMGGLVSEYAAREAILAGIDALGQAIHDPPHPKDADIEATLARVRARHQRVLERAQRVAEATFHGLTAERDSYGCEDGPPPPPRSLS